VAAGRFQVDLFDRMSDAQVIVPPLRERPEDTLLIAESVLQAWSDKSGKRLKGFSQAARELLSRYSFPGNVCELRQLVERAVMWGREEDVLQPWDLCGNQSCPYLGGVPQGGCGFCHEELTAGARRLPAGPLTSLAAAREHFERDYIMSAIEQAAGNHAVAARILGLSEKMLKEKCKRHDILLITEDVQASEGG
jgi:transcriptional regulator with GAF, ATPase, and Fis domain